MPRLSNIPFAPRRVPFFYGYVIIVCSFLGTALSAPGQTVGVSVFTDYLLDAMSVSRYQLSIAYMIGTFVSSLVIARTGALIDRFGVRLVAVCACVGMGGALGYMSRVDKIASFAGQVTGIGYSVLVSLITVTIGFFFIRFLGQGIMALTARVMLMKWFDRLRGRANSIVGAAVALSLSGAPVVFESLIGGFGWRGAWLLLAVIVAVGFSLFVLVFYRDNPEACGLAQDGDPRPHYASSENEEPNDCQAGEAKHDKDDWTLPQARRTKTFWVFNLSISFFSFYFTALTFHVVSVFKTSGHSRADAVAIFLPASAIAIVTNLFFGWLSDRPFFKYRLKYFLMVLITAMSVSAVSMLILHLPAARYIMIAGNGLANGVFGTLLAVPWARYFGRAHLGAINGFNQACLAGASAVGPLLFGLSFQITGEYTIAALICCGALAILGISTIGADRPLRS